MARGDQEQDTSFNYEEDLRINKHKLDREFEKHPILHMRYATLAAQADASAKRAQEKVKTIRSEIIMTAARDGIPNIPKPTGPQIEAYYRVNFDYREAKAEVINAEETAQLLNNAVSAMHARRIALENLAQFHHSGYFSSPKAPEGSNLGDDENLKTRAGETAKRKAKERK